MNFRVLTNVERREMKPERAYLSKQRIQPCVGNPSAAILLQAAPHDAQVGFKLGRVAVGTLISGTGMPETHDDEADEAPVQFCAGKSCQARRLFADVLRIFIVLLAEFFRNRDLPARRTQLLADVLQ